MPRVVRLPERLIGVIIDGCWGCPFFDGSDARNQHCNLKEHFGLERTHTLDDGFEIGCPLEDVSDEERARKSVPEGVLP